ncbi:EPIDERMAL PATTERNING FACTOR-like protein 5 [Malania oleifera]|uniref:EPIDERMAL PATTERNING FACTOR-like protein 5 n=1 Tax=Malania oleifera TaxID=397392 RepID=UPI0025AE431B|nr:EPIDERMAL PATTERNING FACTOR-like protein 5 [Malania oleifera]
MKRRLYCFLVVLQVVSWVSAASRPFASNDGHSLPQQGTTHSRQPTQTTSSSQQVFKGRERGEGLGKMKEAETYYSGRGGEKKIGSRPPNCENKCYGCSPCEAVQVPTTSASGHVGVQYANYEPEGWKCKCGPSFYTP